MKGGRADEEVMEIRNVCIKYEFNARVQTHADAPVNSAFDQEYDQEKAVFFPPPKPFCQVQKAARLCGESIVEAKLKQ